MADQSNGSRSRWSRFGFCSRYQFAYNNRGDKTSETDPLGRVTSYTYDDEQRVLTVTLPDPDGAGSLTSPVLSTAYNGVGWVTSQTDARGGVTSTTYDNFGRVLTVTQPDPDGAGSLTAPVTTNEYNAQGSGRLLMRMARPQLLHATVRDA